MKERPILFSAPMVLAILDGRKTQTRRLCAKANDTPFNPAVAVYPDGSGKGWIAWWGAGSFSAEQTRRLYPGEDGFKCPYGAAGDRLWVRETWALEDMPGGCQRVLWRADLAAASVVDDGGLKTTGTFYLGSGYEAERWRPSIHMPRWASRIDLEITEVRCERLQDITEEDILAEGVTVDRAAEWTGIPWSSLPTLHHAWAALWDHINGNRAPWASNPWVFAITFKRVRP